MDLKLKNNTKLKFDKYIPVEYIESTGAVNINTGVVWQMNSAYSNKVDCTIQIIGSASSTSSIYIADGTSRKTYLNCNNSATNFIVTSSYSSGSRTTVTIDGKSHIVHERTKITIDDVSTSISASSFVNTSGYVKILPTASSGLHVRFWKFDVYNASGVLAAQFIPVISLETGHEGEACFYNKISNTFVYSSSSGSFEAFNTQHIYSAINSLYIEGCPNMPAIVFLRACNNLTRIRCNIGNVSGTLEELQYYTTLSGYSDNFEEQTKPRIVGTFTVTSIHTNAELQALDGLIDGLTILSDNLHNVNYLIDNDLLAVQTFDDEANNYNPAAAIRLNNLGIGSVHTTPIKTNGGRYLLTKTGAAARTSVSDTWFANVKTLTDTNAIVTNDDTATYSFTSFNEFKFFTGLTSIPNSSGSGTFYNCTNLTSIEIPEGVTSIGHRSFLSCTALHRIVLPSTLTYCGDSAFGQTSRMNGGSVYFNGTLQQWMNITHYTNGVAGRARSSSPTCFGAHLYIQGTELTSLTIPDGFTSIKAGVFFGCKYITGPVVIPGSVTALGLQCFNGSGITELLLPNTVTSIDSYAFGNMTSLKDLHIPFGVTVYRFLQESSVTGTCGAGTGTLVINGGLTMTGKVCTILFNEVIIKGNISTNWYDLKVGDTHALRVLGTVSTTFASSSNSGLLGSKNTFFECMNNVTVSQRLIGNQNTSTTTILHLGYNAMVSMTPTAANMGKISMIYVGDGTSRANDETVLALYTANSSWASYTSKLATWYDYNGPRKWYYITDNLVNCSNNNPDEWPHITRGESYETTISPNEGYSLQNSHVTIEMLDTDTTSPTYDTMVDVTADCTLGYFPGTGEVVIQIPSVTGNVVITASAS